MIRPLVEKKKSTTLVLAMPPNEIPEGITLANLSFSEQDDSVSSAITLPDSILGTILSYAVHGSDTQELDKMRTIDSTLGKAIDNHFSVMFSKRRILQIEGHPNHSLNGIWEFECVCSKEEVCFVAGGIFGQDDFLNDDLMPERRKIRCDRYTFSQENENPTLPRKTLLLDVNKMFYDTRADTKLVRSDMPCPLDGQTVKRVWMAIMKNNTDIDLRKVVAPPTNNTYGTYELGHCAEPTDSGKRSVDKWYKFHVPMSTTPQERTQIREINDLINGCSVINDCTQSKDLMQQLNLRRCQIIDAAEKRCTTFDLIIRARDGYRGTDLSCPSKP